ncbi:MAG: polyphosphate kinase 1, partial [Desulfurobacteriaceae bacterium]
MGSAKKRLNLSAPELYINRELSWLEFNRRVLEEAQDETNPLLERLKFIAIFFTNLDEFFMIRVAGLKKMVAAGINRPSFDGLTPKEQLKRISRKTRELLRETESTYRKLISLLMEEGIHVYSYSKLPSRLKKKADSYFKEFVFPVLTPLAVDLTHPFPHLPSLSFNIIVEMIGSELRFGLVPIPKVLPRFVELEEGKFVYLEDLIVNHLDELFPEQEIRSFATFKVTRDADIVIQEDEADDLLEAIEKGLRSRKFGEPVRLEINGGSELTLSFLKDELELEEDDIYRMNIPLKLSDFWSLYRQVERPDLKFPPYIPYYPPQFEVEVFTALKSGSSVLFHPYESFDPIVELIEEAADDPNVLAIKQTLYRVGKNSPIVEALSRAAQKGKEVTAIVELKARFDEESNIVWAKKLEEDGVHVVYGVPGLKT